MIRNAITADLPGMLSIMNDVIASSTTIYEYLPMTQEWLEQWFVEKQAGNWPVIVYELDGQVAGYGYYGSFRTRPAYRFTIEHSVYVRKDIRGGGIGGRLLTALTDHARQAGYHTMVAGIDAANTGSIAFHERHGFVQCGQIREVGYKFDRWLDLVFMQQLL